jgi:hypothetical protein
VKDCYVLGGGIAGLISGYILGWPIICERPGGQLDSEFPLGPRILEKTKDTEWLLKNLGIKAEPRIFTIGYLIEDNFDYKFIDSVPPKGFAEDYYFKTRGIRKTTNSSMSGGRNEIEGWDIYSIGLVNELVKRVGIIPLSIVSIRHQSMLACEPHYKHLGFDKVNIVDQRIYYKKLINTIPAPSLALLRGNKVRWESFKAYDTTFVKVRTSDILTGDFDYIYISDISYPVHRITKVCPGEYVLEFRGDRYTYGCVPELRHLSGPPRWSRVGSEITLKNAQIVESLPVLGHLESITPIGRYAQWNHSVKIEDVIRSVRDIASR